MTNNYCLEFRSVLRAPPAQVWNWVISLRGINAEFNPVIRTTAPAGVQSLLDVTPEQGKPLYRSWMLLFGIVPVAYLDVTLVELKLGSGFVEQSPMSWMRLWRHERRLLDPSGDGDSCVVVDNLHFQPFLGGRLARYLVRKLYEHRHAVLRTQFNAG